MIKYPKIILRSILAFIILLTPACTSKKTADKDFVFNPYPKGNCVTHLNDKVCCSPKQTKLPVIKTQQQFEKHSSYSLIKDRIGPVDFSIFDLIVVSPGDLAMTFEFTGTPTTMGTEWQIYNSISVGCNQDSISVSLDCRPTAGYGGTFYSKKILKLNKDTVRCGCHSFFQK
jgi:hypothetical protein